MFKLTTQKRALLRWAGWFFAGNIILFWLLGLKYTHSISWLGTEYLTKHAALGVTVFLVTGYFAQLALLAFLPFFLVLGLILVFSSRHFIFCCTAIIAALWAVALISDTLIYNLFHFHLNGIVLNLILSSTHEDFFNFSIVETLTVVSIVGGLLIAEFVFAYLLWRHLAASEMLRGLGKWITAVISVLIYASYTMLIFSANQPYARFYLEAARIMPYYIEILGAMLPIHNGEVALERVFEKYVVQPAQASEPLNYPRQKLQFSNPQQKLNVVIIGVDTWRFDMLHPVVTPHIFQFARHATVFKNHFSGGDATGPGVFSLFYGLPGTYWTAMEKQHRAPLLLERLQQQHYQLEILASAGLTLPPLNKTVFQNVKYVKIKVPGVGPYEHDLAVTKEFKHFLATRDAHQPFFSFLFYDSSHSYCAIKNADQPFHPSVKNCDRLVLNKNTDLTPYFNRYKNALHLVDKEVGQVLAELQAKNLLNNTVIIITGDHGEEFNDNHLGFWGHTSNFTRYQTQTPLLIYWPGQKPAVVQYRTTHYDVAATLMAKIAGCITAPEQYSLGHSLWLNKPTPYLLEGSYIGFGIVEKDRITNVFPTGNYQVSDPSGQLMADAKLRPEVMHHAYLDMSRFYRMAG